MRKLANLIENELRTQEICAVYNSELARVWPRTMSLGKRKQQIKRFAKDRDLAVTFYDVGLCAIFEKAEAPTKTVRPVLLLEREDGKRPRKRRS